MWFVFALLTTLAWGCADLFYKKGADESQPYSHLRISIFVGLVMGIHAIYMLIFSVPEYDFRNILIYAPVSVMYILSMVCGYFGLRYLELSISSPIQNSSGAVSCILCLIFLGQTLDFPTAVAVILISLGVLLLGIFEKQKEDLYEKTENKKYKIGFVAFFMPILYCIIDSLGTFFDAYYLDDIDATPLLGVTPENFENVANISYELTFLLVAIILFIYVFIIKRAKFSPAKLSVTRTTAAVFETVGQFFYVYAMSGNGAVAAPLIGSYCMVSVALSAIFLREKLPFKQYIAIAVTFAGILLLSIIEG